MKKILKTQYGIIGAGVGLGVGNTILGAMGQGSIATKISGPASNMLGVATTANMGMGVMNFVNKQTRRKKRKISP